MAGEAQPVSDISDITVSDITVSDITVSDITVSDITVSDIKYDYRADVFKIVEYLYNTGLLNDIECRKIVTVDDVVPIRGVMYLIISTKDSQSVKKILEVFRRRLYPFQNPVVLRRMFSYLKYDDLANCKIACPHWKEIANSLVIAKYDHVNLDQFLLKLLYRKNEKIKHRERQNYYVKTEAIASIFQIMLAINPDNDEAMLEILQIGRNVLHVDYSSINVTGTSENKIHNLIGNVMSNNTAVLRNVFQFLSLASIKYCRTVCRTWNEVSETFVRKRAAVKFDYHFGPADFINVSKYLSLPDLPFKNFKFASHGGNRYKTLENMREGLSEFFTKFGKNIQSLELVYQWDIRSYLSNTCNLTELKLQSGEMYSNIDPGSDMMIPWNALHSIKILSLKNAVIDVGSEINLKRIAPLKVQLNAVRFFVGGRYTDEMTLNDYIDFTNVTDIDVKRYNNQIKFDWSRDTFKAKRITFSDSDIRFLNTEKSKSSVDYLNLFSHSFSEKIGLPVKQLIIGQPGLSLANLPTSLEKLAICPKNSSNVISSDQPVYLPNLNYLFYGMRKAFHLLTLFDYCPLTDIVILGMVHMKIDIRWLPRNVKKMKVFSRSGKLTFLGGSTNEHFDLDLLILNFVSCRRLRRLNFDQLRPRVLVVQVRQGYQHKDFVCFLKRSKHMEKIYVRFPSTPYVRARRQLDPIDFNDNELSNIVDKESDYYEFSNERGKAITSKEFFIIHRSLDMKIAMKEFWNVKNGEHSSHFENFYRNFEEEYDYELDEPGDYYSDRYFDDDDDSYDDAYY